MASLRGRLGGGGVNATDRGVYAPLPVIPTSSDEEGIADGKLINSPFHY